jgi:hypothetical protein
MVYNNGGSTELNFRCRHSSRSHVFATALPGFMYWCLCHAHGEKGLEYNLNICPPKRHALLPISSKEGWRRNYIIYWLRKIPTLFQLAMANVFGSDQMHYLENSKFCPKEILDKTPVSYRLCLRLNCRRETDRDCRGFCRTKIQCRYAQFRSMRLNLN